jgi:hypothetical protein
LGKKFYNSWKLAQIFFFSIKKIIFNFVKFVATKKVWQIIFFQPSLLLLFMDPESGMGKIQDLGSEINIPDPQMFSSIVLESSCISAFYHPVRYIFGHICTYWNHKTKFARIGSRYWISGLGYFLDKDPNRCTLLAGDVEPQKGLNDL